MSIGCHRWVMVKKPVSTRRTLDKKRLRKTDGKLDPPVQQPKCPDCNSKRVWRDGLRRFSDGRVTQRWLCRDCGLRFSESTAKTDPHPHNLSSAIRQGQRLNRPSGTTGQRQVCAALAEGAKNLAEVETRTKKWAAGATEQDSATVRGKILEYGWWMKRQGYAELTIKTRVQRLLRLAKLCNLMSPSDVAEAIARQRWAVNTKATICVIYSGFLKWIGLTWERPIYKLTPQIPFIPTETEIDQLIAGAGKKLATLLQLLKETGMRIGEAVKLRWTDIDLAQRTVRVRAEKGSNPRIFRVTDTLVNMINMLPRKGEHIFNPNSSIYRTMLVRVRTRMAHKLENPRLKAIHFHTFRHWKATELYHRTKDILYVKDFLGHKKVDNTLIYINIERAIFGGAPSDEFHVKVAQTPEEIKGLLETGFEYTCEKDGLLFFKKRK